jgi:hypothetical protein
LVVEKVRESKEWIIKWGLEARQMRYLPSKTFYALLTEWCWIWAKICKLANGSSFLSGLQVLQVWEKQSSHRKSCGCSIHSLGLMTDVLTTIKCTRWRLLAIRWAAERLCFGSFVPSSLNELISMICQLCMIALVKHVCS